MLKREKTKFINRVSKEHTIPMRDVETVVDELFMYSSTRVDSVTENTTGISFGILSLDSKIEIKPGITIMYSQPDGGKTSFLKTVAKTGVEQGLNVLYYDAENKLCLHDLVPLDNVIIAKTYRDSGMKEVIKSGHIDMVIVDTITSVFKTSQWSFIHDIKKHVPYIILAAQMRTDISSGISVPACDPTLLSSSHTILYFTSKESIRIENKKLVRVQYNVIKYEANRDMENLRDSLIICNNMVDILYSAYDILKARNIITTHGRDKLLDNVNIGSIKNIVYNSDEWNMMVGQAISELIKPIF